MLLATAIAAALLRRRQENLRINKLQQLGIAIGGLVGATLAAKLPFILGADPATGLWGAWLSDGKTILWALVGGYLGVEVAKWSLHVSTSTGDTFVIPVALAIATGRVGCLLYGCCYGIETDQTWGVRFVGAPDGGTVLRHPAQLYEIVFHVSFALVAWIGIGNPRAPSFLKGNWMPIYMIAYAGFRFGSEYWRPEQRLAANLTFYQWSAVVIAISFALLLVYRAAKRTDHTV
jgi:prolipoprotein diacylglyceryltransferase